MSITHLRGREGLAYRNIGLLLVGSPKPQMIPKGVQIFTEQNVKTILFTQLNTQFGGKMSWTLVNVLRQT